MASFDDTDPHRSFGQLEALLQERFVSRADKVGLPNEPRSHFRVHCLKHDLEALLLAAPDELRQRLKTKDALRRLPSRVEDQNDENPPKKVVEALFAQYLKKKYIDTVDAPWILERASGKLRAIEAACPQFGRFVRELRALSEGRDPHVTEGAG